MLSNAINPNMEKALGVFWDVKDNNLYMSQPSTTSPSSKAMMRLKALRRWAINKAPRLVLSGLARP